jgi:hypothetical protein
MVMATAQGNQVGDNASFWQGNDNRISNNHVNQHFYPQPGMCLLCYLVTKD